MMSIRKSVSVVLALLSLLTQSGAAASPPLQIVAHRGLLLLAPENTLANMRACLELRLGFEFDVQRTQDGELVCVHDDTVDRTTNGSGPVAELTLDEIRRLDAGSWFHPAFAGEHVPTVEEVFRLVAEYPQHRVLLAADLKAQGVEVEIVRLAEKHNVLDRVLFIGRTITESDVRDRIKCTSPVAATAAVANNPAEFHAALVADNADWVYLRFVPSREQLEAVRRAGKRSFIAGPTVAGQLPDNWQRAVDAGIDGILTDYPLELRKLTIAPAAR